MFKPIGSFLAQKLIVPMHRKWSYSCRKNISNKVRGDAMNPWKNGVAVVVNSTSTEPIIMAT